MQTDGLSTWLEIDLGAIRNNVRRLGAITGGPVMAVVKANGYGHGLVEAARAAQKGGAAWCGVARLDEALALRAGGVTLPVLVLGYTPALRIAEAIREHISLALCDPQMAEAYSQRALESGGKILVHAKFDTGMGRLGIFPEEGVPFIQHLTGLPGLNLEGCFTHFAKSDDEERDITGWQVGRFRALLDALQPLGLRPRWAHAANSAGALYYPEAQLDLVRCGISIYGLHPSAETPLPEGFQAALTWKARLASVKMLPAGHGIGYNYRYRTSGIERIGAVAVGYADGLRRRLGNFALVGGKRVNVVGGVCMDQIMLQLDDVPDAKIGDEVVLIGRQGEAQITAEELGRAWGSVNYDVVCGLTARVPRIYYE